MSTDSYNIVGNSPIVGLSPKSSSSDVRDKVTTTAAKVSKVTDIGNYAGAGISGVGGLLHKTTQVGLTTQAALAASGALCPAGAIIGLATDCITLALRSGHADKLRQELEKIPEGDGYQYKHDIIEACRTHAIRMATSSSIAVASDSIGVAGSFVPVLGLPATAIALSVAIVRIFAEKGMDKELKNALQLITDDYRKENPELVKNPQAFKDLYQVLKDAHTQTLAVKDQAQKDLDDVMAAHRKLGLPKEGLPRVVKANEALFTAEIALKQTEFDLQECETAMANFEAYENAFNLIPELDELIKKEKEQRDTIRYVESDLSKKGLNFDTAKSELEKHLKSLEKQLHPKNTKDHEDHSISAGLDRDYHRNDLLKDLRRTKAVLHNYNHYTEACKGIKKLDQKRAEIAEMVAAKKAEEQRKLLSQPLSHDDLLTTSTHTPVSNNQPNINIHVSTKSRHLPKIKTQLTPTSEADDPQQLRIFSGKPRLTPPSSGRSVSTSPTPKVASPTSVNGSFTRPLSPQSGTYVAPSLSLVDLESVSASV